MLRKFFSIQIDTPEDFMVLGTGVDKSKVILKIGGNAITVPIAEVKLAVHRLEEFYTGTDLEE